MMSPPAERLLRRHEECNKGCVLGSRDELLRLDAERDDGHVRDLLPDGELTTACLPEWAIAAPLTLAKAGVCAF